MKWQTSLIALLVFVLTKVCSINLPNNRELSDENYQDSDTLDSSTYVGKLIRFQYFIQERKRVTYFLTILSIIKYKYSLVMIFRCKKKKFLYLIFITELF